MQFEWSVHAGSCKNRRGTKNRFNIFKCLLTWGWPNVLWLFLSANPLKELPQLRALIYCSIAATFLCISLTFPCPTTLPRYATVACRSQHHPGTQDIHPARTQPYLSGAGTLPVHYATRNLLLYMKRRRRYYERGALPLGIYFISVSINLPQNKLIRWCNPIILVCREKVNRTPHCCSHWSWFNRRSSRVSEDLNDSWVDFLRFRIDSR